MVNDGNGNSKLECLVNKKIICFAKNGFRFAGIVKDFDGRFIEIFDEVKKRTKFLAADEIAEIEVAE